LREEVQRVLIIISIYKRSNANYCEKLDGECVTNHCYWTVNPNPPCFFEQPNLLEKKYKKYLTHNSGKVKGVLAPKRKKKL